MGQPGLFIILMRVSQLRSTSTKTRIKPIINLDESSSLSFYQKNLMISSSTSHKKSLKTGEKFKLPHLHVYSSMFSSQETSITMEANEETVFLLKASFQAECEEKGIPEELQKIFAEKVWGLPRHKAVAIVNREIEDLRNDRSAVIPAIKAVAAREQSLQSIHEVDKYLARVTGWELLKKVQLECAELLHAHRLLTINAVESIVKWREFISFSALINSQSSSLHIPFMLKNVNYLIKMKSDLNFLKKSEFSKVFQFDISDPLLVKPSKSAVKTKEKKIDSNYFLQYGKVVVTLPSSLKVRVEYAERIIGREAEIENMMTPEQVDVVSNEIYEELCEEEVENDVGNYINCNKPQVVLGVNDDILDEFLGNMCEIVVKECKVEGQKENDEKMLIENYKCQALQEVNDDILNEYLKEMCGSVAKECKVESKKEKRVKNYANNNKTQIIQELNDGIFEEFLMETCEIISQECKLEETKETQAKIAQEVKEKLLDDEIGMLLYETAKDGLKIEESPIKETLIDEQKIKEDITEKSQKNLKKSKENNEIAEQLRNDCIEFLRSSLLLEISKDSQSNELSETVIDSIYSDILAKFVQETLINKLTTDTVNAEITEIIRNDFIDLITKQYLNEILSDLQSNHIKNSLIDSIYSDMLCPLIEETISLAYSTSKFHEETKKKNFLNDLSDIFYESLFSELLPDIEDMVSEAYEEGYDIYFDREELVESMGMEFFRKPSTFNDFSSFVFKKISAPKSIFRKIVEEYYKKIPKPLVFVTAEQSKLKDEIDKVESHWFWGLINNVIVGLLVFSVNFDRSNTKVIIIHHLTCLYFKFYLQFIEAATNFIWDSDTCQEIRLNLYTSGQAEIPSDIKKVLNSLKFRWKTNLLNEDEGCSIIVMGQFRPENKINDPSIEKLKQQNEP